MSGMYEPKTYHCIQQIKLDLIFYHCFDIVCRQQLLEQAMEKDGLTEEQVCSLSFNP